MNESEKNCTRIRGLLADRAVGQLAPGAGAEIDQHLRACADCRKWSKELAATAAFLDRAPEAEPSPAFDARLREKTRAIRAERARGRVTVFAVVLAGLRRLRQFELGAAVYPLVALTMGYIAWAMLQPGPGLPARPPSGKVRFDSEFRLARARRLDSAPRAEEPARAETAEAGEPTTLLEDTLPEAVTENVSSEDELAARREFVDASPYVPAPVEEPPEPRAPPSEPPERQPARPVVLPGGGPRGSALARARYTTIRDSKLRPVVWAGLLWLIKHQADDGHWEPAADSAYSAVEVTAAGSLALMEAGYSPGGRSKAAARLRAALSWLAGRERDDGTFGVTGARQAHAQAMALTALSEALRLTDNATVRRRFRPLVTRALTNLIERQESSGRWEDAELTTLTVTAMGAARAAGLAVNAEPHRQAVAWLCEYESSFGTPVLANRSSAAEPAKDVSFATIGRVLAGDRELLGSADAASEAAEKLAAAEVVWERGDFFRWYAGTLAAYRLDGRPWEQWRNQLLRGLIVDGWREPPRRRSDRGSWRPHAQSKGCGRCYSTAMAVLAITATYGHSPVYGGTK